MEGFANKINIKVPSQPEAEDFVNLRVLMLLLLGIGSF